MPAQSLMWLAVVHHKSHVSIETRFFLYKLLCIKAVMFESTHHNIEPNCAPLASDCAYFALATTSASVMPLNPCSKADIDMSSQEQHSSPFSSELTLSDGALCQLCTAVMAYSTLKR
jgi:hypothetical protein